MKSAAKVVRVLRHKETRAYFASGDWTPDPSQAEIFSDAIHAARACVAHRLQNVELVLRVEASSVDLFRTPLS